MAPAMTRAKKILLATAAFLLLMLASPLPAAAQSTGGVPLGVYHHYRAANQDACAWLGSTLWIEGPVGVVKWSVVWAQRWGAQCTGYLPADDTWYYVSVEAYNPTSQTWYALAGCQHYYHLGFGADFSQSGTCDGLAGVAGQWHHIVTYSVYQNGTELTPTTVTSWGQQP